MAWHALLEGAGGRCHMPRHAMPRHIQKRRWKTKESDTRARKDQRHAKDGQTSAQGSPGRSKALKSPTTGREATASSSSVSEPEAVQFRRLEVRPNERPRPIAGSARRRNWELCESDGCFSLGARVRNEAPGLAAGCGTLFLAHLDSGCRRPYHWPAFLPQHLACVRPVVGLPCFKVGGCRARTRGGSLLLSIASENLNF